MTEVSGKPAADGLGVVREILRRSGHEIRNALNGVAVNVEVVRSRKGGGGEVAAFAERASMDVSRASSLTNGVLALVEAVLTSMSNASLRASRHGDVTEIELMIYGDRAAGFVSGIAPMVDEIGISVEQRGESVILRVLPEDRSHSKN